MSERPHDGNGDGSGDGVGTGTALETRGLAFILPRGLRGNGGDLGGTRKKCRQERIGSVAANPGNLENSKEAGGEAQGTQGLSLTKNCTSRQRAPPLSHLIRVFF